MLFAEVVISQISFNGGYGAPLSGMSAGNHFSITAYGYIKADCTIPVSTCGGSANLTVGGLKMRYCSDTNFQNVFAETNTPLVAYTWGYGGPLSGMNGSFSMTFSGMMRTDYTGWYELRRLWVNRQLMIDSTGDCTIPIYFVAGQMNAVFVEYINTYGYASINFYWRPHDAYEHLPHSNNLFYYDSECECEPNLITGLIFGGTDQGVCTNSYCGCRSMYNNPS